eukprot:3789782-Alexandrium_andersonii.AAC.1
MPNGSTRRSWASSAKGGESATTPSAGPPGAASTSACSEERGSHEGNKDSGLWQWNGARPISVP